MTESTDWSIKAIEREIFGLARSVYPDIGVRELEVWMEIKLDDVANMLYHKAEGLARADVLLSYTLFDQNADIHDPNEKARILNPYNLFWNVRDKEVLA